MVGGITATDEKQMINRTKKYYGRRFTARWFVFLVLAILCFLRDGSAGTLDQELKDALQRNSREEAFSVLIRFTKTADLSLIIAASKADRFKKVITTLKTHAQRSQKNILSTLAAPSLKIHTKKITPLWICNGIALTAAPDVIRKLAQLPGAFTITVDKTIELPQTSGASVESAEWNLNIINAPFVWDQGCRGQGVVVATMDSGVDVEHPDLALGYRGGSNSWYDPYGEHATPFDADGHGTQVMGVIAGRDASGTNIGVAPEAKWIAVKIFNDAGKAAYSAIHAGLQWLLDPDGNPETDDAPDIVNNSWGLNNVGTCEDEFQGDINALRAAGILPMFAAGNSGPGENTSISPANNAGAFSVGATNENDAAEITGSRGPSACTGGIYPTVTAPGVHIYTADLSFGGNLYYTTVSGTSFASPHVAGAAALLLSAFSPLDSGETEAALNLSAVDLGDAGPDNVFGYGRIDVKAAFDVFETMGKNHAPLITSTPKTKVKVWQLYYYQVTAVDPDSDQLSYSLTTAIPGLVINKKTGWIWWIPGWKHLGMQEVEVQVTDSNGGIAHQRFTIEVGKWCVRGSPELKN